MKKIYIAPLTVVVKTKAAQMICASPNNVTLNLESAQISDGYYIGSKDDEDFDDLW